MSGRVKRIAAPAQWPVERKVHFWNAKPSPGPHSMRLSLPLLNVVRDMLSLCDTSKEARLAINGGGVLVDGVVRKDSNFPVGIMDVLSIPSEQLYFRMMIDHRKRMHLVPISEQEAVWKICRIEGKSVLRGGKGQVHLHDGRNLLNAQGNTGDSVRIELPSQKVLNVYRLEPGARAVITGGSHTGQIATVDRFVEWKNPAPNLVYFKEGFSTVWHNVFVFGTEPLLKVPEVPLQ